MSCQEEETRQEHKLSEGAARPLPLTSTDQRGSVEGEEVQQEVQQRDVC